MKTEPPDDNAGRGDYPTWPAESVQQDFLSHVKETGRPDTWVGHSVSKPPSDDDYHEALRFNIRSKKHPDIGMASCPICSPMAPKYYEGALAWFPKEWRLRAIGHECAKGHFGEGAAAKSKEERQRRLAEHYLLEELPKHRTLRERAAKLEQPAAAIDDMRTALFRAASKAGWLRIARLGAAGALPIEEMHEVNVVDGFGRASTSQQSRTVETIAVEGVSFLAEQYSTLLAARNAITAAGRVAACSDEEALELVVAISPNLDDLLVAERLLRAAVSAVEDVERKVATARAFLRADNLERLHAWTHDLRVDVGVVVSYSRHGQFRVRGQGDWRILSVPHAIWPSY